MSDTTDDFYEVSYIDKDDGLHHINYFCKSEDEARGMFVKEKHNGEKITGIVKQEVGVEAREVINSMV